MSKKLFTSTFTHEGKRHYVRSTKSQKDADQKAAIKRKELEDNTIIISPNTTVEQYATIWLETYKEGKVSEPVYSVYKSTIKRLINPEIGRLKLKDVRPINLQRIINAQKDKSKNYYVKLRHTIQQIFDQAHRDHLIRDNPSDRLDIPSSKDGTHRSITPRERQAILFAADWHSFGLFVLTTLWCGLRPQEVAALRWEDIDRVNHKIHVRRALKADGRMGETMSVSGIRSVPIPPQFWMRLQPRLPDSGYLFLSSRREHHTKSSIRNAWDALKTQIDIALGAKVVDGAVAKSVIADDLTMYCLRHTYCTDLQAAGVPINVARDLMGHSSIELTARIYTHMRDDIMDDAAAKIAAYGATVGATLNPSETRLKPITSADEIEQKRKPKTRKSV